MVERLARGLLDTDVVIDWKRIDPLALPIESSISAITLAELSVGPLVADDEDERTGRQTQLQQVESAFDALPFDAAAARTYPALHAAVRAVGRAPRRRIADLFIACVAAANDLPLFTANPQDYVGLDRLIQVVAVQRSHLRRS